MLQKILSYLYKEPNLELFNNKLNKHNNYKDNIYIIRINNNKYCLEIIKNLYKIYNIKLNKLIFLTKIKDTHSIFYDYLKNLKSIYIFNYEIENKLHSKNNSKKSAIVYRLNFNYNSNKALIVFDYDIFIDTFIYNIYSIKIHYINHSIFKIKYRNNVNYLKYKSNSKSIYNIFNSKYNLYYYSNMFYLLI
jgi:hypothetical protein